MRKNPSAHIADEKLDKLARTVVRSAILSDAEIEEIADAPLLWRKTQNRLAVEKARREKRRFFGWRWQWATVAAFAILIAAFAAFLHFLQLSAEIAATSGGKIEIISTDFSTDKSQSPNRNIVPVESPETYSNNKEKFVSQTKTIRAQTISSNKFTASNAAKIKSERQKETRNASNPQKKTATETATEFIALSYLPASESGQVVRVKVPRSMMVSLGVTTKTEKTSELVNAEVVLGDDGAARSIRFLGDE